MPECMETIIEARSGESLNLPQADHKIKPFDAETLRRHAPVAHYGFLREDRLVARCSIWAEGTPTYLGQRAGVLGHYAAADQSAGVALLNHATQQLHHRGFTSIIGPMDGNTWRRYRLLTTRGSEPPFFMEPDNPDDWPTHFTAAGFAPLARYFSALNSDLSVLDPRVPDALARLTAAGVRIRSINVSRFEEELKAVHELSVEAFAGNFLYTPISQPEFVSMYAPIRPHVRPELILLAEQDSQLIGFMFGLPDLAQAERGQPITTAIAKSMAVRLGRNSAGLGSVLMDQFQQAARRMGFTRVIHALMHEDNRSLKISSRFAHSIRQYTLYVKGMGP